MKEIPHNIKNILKNLPLQPGVYIMKDTGTNIIYIGKANSLKKRVASYFRKSGLDPKTQVLIKNISDIEYIVTDSEIEALVLESTLIKKHRPRYNIRLKDDKRYPYIAVTLSESYPRVIITRRLLRNGDRYFGPYTDAKAARSAVYTVNTIFKLKECAKKLPLKNRERPCLNFHMKRCPGLCQGTTSAGEYNTLVEKAVQFLNGDIEPVLGSLGQLMSDFSRKQEYEKAAQIRDIISDIRTISEKQKVYTPIGMDQDLIGISNQEGEAVVVIFQFRSGALIGRKILIFENISFHETGETLKSSIINYYDNIKIPPRIVTQFPVADKKLLADHLRIKSGAKVKISVPVSKAEKSIMNMLQKNIDIIIADRNAARNHEEKIKGLIDLKNILKMEDMPEIIECFDISNIQGKLAVASMVRFRHGAPDRSGYRRYKIKSYDSANDPGMIHEAVGRRIQYLVNEELELPDLVVIDGGRPQLNRALEIKSAFGLDITIISLAKRFEEIYTGSPEGPIRLSKTSEALKIIQNIRDEAHRFAISYHKKLREREGRKSVIDSIPDIGAKKKNLLLKHFKSVHKIENAGIDEIAGIRGIGRKTAEDIYSFFRKTRG
ncbi:MAG: excinuclease ABC subunit UvrC [Spirochaetes bacterium]|jgi:excinuclease ABC subunit C|nr:excinuclease ABC subunit UvrC [Spirochaetota bacterium]